MAAGQVVHMCAPLLTKQYNLVPVVKGQWRFAAGKVTIGLTFALAMHHRLGGSDIPVTETQTDTEVIDFRKTHTETNTDKIFNTDTIYTVSQKNIPDIFANARNLYCNY